MPDNTTLVVLPVNPTGNHWVAVEITSRGTISVFDSAYNNKVMAHRIASLIGRALPLLAHTISLRPSCTWNSDIFLNVKVDYLDTPQQPNSWDCGQCTAMHLIHTLREEPQEDINH